MFVTGLEAISLDGSENRDRVYYVPFINSHLIEETLFGGRTDTKMAAIVTFSRLA